MKLSKNYKKRGFTIVELMVVVTIMVIMTTVVLFNYNKFNESMLLSNFAYDMSLTIRQAQTYGVAVLEAPSATGSTLNHSNFTYPYGVHLEPTPVNSFILFVDNPTNPAYKGMYVSADAAFERLQSYKFQRGIKIKDICVNDLSGTTQCGLTGLDITFLRPDPDARIIATGGTASCTSLSNPCGSASIVLSTAGGDITKNITISRTGQISVQ